MPEFVATGKYFEDCIPGEEKLSPGRTITSGDLDLFAEWSDDPTVADTRAADGRRIVSATLLINLTDCLVQRLGVVEGTGYCNLGWRWQFEKPVYEWDTIWIHARWDASRPSRTIKGTGVVELTVTILNQHDEAVASAKWANLILSRENPHGSAAA